jgi:predicted amidohydrolase
VHNTTIGYAQFAPLFGGLEANHATIRRLTGEGKTADLLVFPELCTSGYDFRDRDELASLAEPRETGPTSILARELAETHQTTLVIGYPEKAGDLFYNSCVLSAPNGTRANYRKLHLFSRESRIFAPGNAPPPVIDTPAGKVGLMICLDWLFPEAARVLALGGAQVIAHPSNLVLPHCQKAMVTRSIENGVFSITANRIGTEKRTDRSLTFTGASQVLGNRGELLVNAPIDTEHLGVVDVDVEQADDKMITEENHLLDDRRIAFYDGLIR